MPRGGHNRKSRTSKIIQGTFRKDRNPVKEPEPTPVSEIPKPPAGMNRWARNLWKSLAAELHELGILTTVDLATLELCCSAYGLYKEAQQEMHRPVDPRTAKRVRRSLGQYLTGVDPWINMDDLSSADLVNLKRNSQTTPELATMKSAWQIYKSYMTELGLSPASRNRINLPAEKEHEADPMERLLHEG